MINLKSRWSYFWKFFWDIQRFWGKEGNWALDPIHSDVIFKVVNSLDRDTKLAVETQLKQEYFFSWMSHGRVNVFYFYDLDKIPLIPDPQFSDKLFKVDLYVEDRRQSAHVIFFEGRIFSVEFKRPREFYVGKEYRVGSVTEGSPKDTFTAVIDRAAHGKETEINP
jgi:hypothetical protein